MTTPSGGNGHGNGALTPARRMRFDRILGPDPLGTGHSGRVLVVAGVTGLAVVAAGLWCGFAAWRAGYQARAEFGRTQVAPVVDALADQVPDGVAPGEWSSAVADTRRILEIVTASGVLDRATMIRLRDELSARVARTTPATAGDELSAIWDDLERKAGPILTRAPTRAPAPPKRPPILRRALGDESAAATVP